MTLQDDSSVLCKSSSDGSYILRDVAPGKHTINISHPCYFSESQEISLVSGASAVKRDLFLDASGYATIHGSISDIFTGKPIVSAAVTSGYGATSRTDIDGLYSMELPACTTAITMHSPGYLSLTRKNINLDVDEILELNTLLFPWPFIFPAVPHSNERNN